MSKQSHKARAYLKDFEKWADSATKDMCHSDWTDDVYLAVHNYLRTCVACGIEPTFIVLFDMIRKQGETYMEAEPK